MLSDFPVGFSNVAILGCSLSSLCGNTLLSLHITTIFTYSTCNSSKGRVIVNLLILFPYYELSRE